jgi:hypothetical protein
MSNCNASILSSGCAKRSFARRATVSFSCLLFLVGCFPEVDARALSQTPQKDLALVQPTQGAEDVRSIEIFSDKLKSSSDIYSKLHQYHLLMISLRRIKR